MHCWICDEGARELQNDVRSSPLPSSLSHRSNALSSIISPPTPTGTRSLFLQLSYATMHLSVTNCSERKRFRRRNVLNVWGINAQAQKQIKSLKLRKIAGTFKSSYSSAELAKQPRRSAICQYCTFVQGNNDAAQKVRGWAASHDLRVIEVDRSRERRIRIDKI